MTRMSQNKQQMSRKIPRSGCLTNLSGCPNRGRNEVAVRRVVFVVVRMGVGGKERVVAHLASQLALRGIEPIVVCLMEKGEFGEQLEAQGVRVVALRSSRLCGVQTVWKLKKVFRMFRPDVINVHDRSSLPYVFFANRMSGKRPVIFSCHGLLFQEELCPRWLEQLAMRDVRAVTAVSDQAACEYSQILRWTGDVEIIHNGVPTMPRLPHLRKAVRAELGLSEDVFVFLAVGNLNPEKGYEDLLEATSLLCRKGDCPSFVVLVAGAKWNKTYWESLSNRLHQLDLLDKVRFLGYRGDTQALYSAADAFVLSSRKEGLPMVLLEAMGTGLPVIATRVGAVPDVVQNEATGLLVASASPAELSEAMECLLANEPLGRRLGAEAMRLVASRYSVERMASCYLNLYRREVLAAGTRTPCLKDASRSAKPRVVMLGPLPPLTGGMATVMDNLRGSDLASRCRLTVLNNGKTTPEGRSVLVGIASQMKMLRRLISAILRRRVQIVHIHTCSGFTFWRDCLHAAIAGLLRSRVVWHVHGGEFSVFAGKQGRIGKAIMRIALTHASAVIALSEDWVGRLRSIAPHAGWCVVPNGIPITTDRVDPHNNKPTFLFLGNLGERKGAQDLVRAAAIASRKGFEGQIHLAGKETEPGQIEAIEKIIAETSCQSQVRLIGVVSGEAKDRALESADCMVLPSYAEGLPMAILEAMACGLPIISTKVGAIPEVITDGVEGFLIEPGDIEALADRIVRLGQDEQLRRQMGAAGRVRVRQSYSIQAMVERLVVIYREVLGQGPADEKAVCRKVRGDGA